MHRWWGWSLRPAQCALRTHVCVRQQSPQLLQTLVDASSPLPLHQRLPDLQEHNRSHLSKRTPQWQDPGAGLGLCVEGAVRVKRGFKSTVCEGSGCSAVFLLNKLLASHSAVCRWCEIRNPGHRCDGKLVWQVRHSRVSVYVRYLPVWTNLSVRFLDPIVGLVFFHVRSRGAGPSRGGHVGRIAAFCRLASSEEAAGEHGRLQEERKINNSQARRGVPCLLCNPIETCCWRWVAVVSIYKGWFTCEWGLSCSGWGTTERTRPEPMSAHPFCLRSGRCAPRRAAAAAAGRPLITHCVGLAAPTPPPLSLLPLMNCVDLLPSDALNSISFTNWISQGCLHRVVQVSHFGISDFISIKIK